MAKLNKIKVMISSRCDDRFPEKSGEKLSQTRLKIKREIELVKIGGESIFEVWINEDAPPADATNDSWEVCMQNVRDCDILIVLTNGNAGWSISDGGIGICHAEYLEGLNSSRGKVRLIQLPYINSNNQNSNNPRNKRFQEFIKEQSAFRGSSPKSVEELLKQVQKTLHDAVIDLTKRGVDSQKSNPMNVGQALNWSRLGFADRKSAMENVLLNQISTLGSVAIKEGNAAIAPIKGEKILFLIHAIPAAISVSAAREMVGRPFLKDHSHKELIKDFGGPIHLIACHKNATEQQAITLLGFPDATVVSGPFGVYVADNIQKIQFVFLANCRDDSQTRLAFQRFIDWLTLTGEDALLAKRAHQRAKIVKAISEAQE
ncbi:MAG: DUF4062 domain-containing protein [Polynucleobacter sp.]